MRLFPRREKAPARVRGCWRGAFTLIELLAASAVLSLLVLFLVGMTNQASSIVTQEQARRQHCQRARAALEFIARDLRAAALPTVTDTGKPSLQLVINPKTPLDIGTDAACRDAIFWQAPIATDPSRGNLAEIGYFARWDGTQANLCRFFVNPSDTPNYKIYSNPSGWLSADLLTAVAPANKAGQYRGLFLENVVGLWVQGRIWVRSGTNPNQYTDTDFAASPYNNDSRANATTKIDVLPAHVELALALLDSATASRVGTTDVQAIRNLYTSSAPTAASARPVDFAAAFTQSLPVKLRSGASVVNLRVSLDNYHGNQ